MKKNKFHQIQLPLLVWIEFTDYIRNFLILHSPLQCVKTNYDLRVLMFLQAAKVFVERPIPHCFPTSASPQEPKIFQGHGQDSLGLSLHFFLKIFTIF